jgi:hypothetical protein
MAPMRRSRNFNSHEENHMISKPRTRTFNKGADAEDSAPAPVGQRKPTESQFRLQVDRQTKSSYATFEAAKEAGLLIKQAHPILQVAIYDAIGSVNKIIELPQSGKAGKVDEGQAAEAAEASEPSEA